MSDLSKLKSIIKNLQKMQNSTVKVGILEENNEVHRSNADKEDDSEGIRVAELGAVHEFGATIQVTDKMRGWLAANKGIYLKKSTDKIIIPKRSFLREPFFEKAEEIQKLAEFLLNVGMEDPEKALKEYGIKLEAISKDSFGKERHESLKFREGTPLVDTGHLRASISSKVEIK